MCRRSSCGLALIAAATLALAGVARADDLAGYLERLGLRSLLADHLESQLNRAEADERTELVDRLSALYAELLETTTDPARQAALEERGRKLLAMAPAASAEKLRIELLRASYRSAERIAEDHRMRLASPEQVQQASETFARIVPELSGIRQTLKEKVEVTERRLSRAIGAEASTLSEAADRQRSLAAQSAFLQAWSMYYQAWLTGKREPARAAEPLFAELMGTESPTPLPDDVSVDLRANESVARSILGMALCRSLSSSIATSLAWLALLEDPNAFEPLRNEVPAWKLGILLDLGDFAQVRVVLDELRQSNIEFPLAWLRLVAVHALEAAATNRVASELSREMVFELAARGEFDQILDLATRYSVEALGESGFALQFVRGVLAYQQARAAHGGDTPTVDAAQMELYETAERALTLALEQQDSKKFESASASCRRLVAWCAYFRGNFLGACDAFTAAAANMDADDAAEARWMAIVCLDRLVNAGGSDNLKNRLATAIDSYLALYPASEHAAELVLKRTLNAGSASVKTVNDLLAIPPGSDVYEAAQGRAADILYRLFRDAPAEDRRSLATQYLGVEMNLIDGGGVRSISPDPAQAQRLVARSRRILEVALADGIADCAIATRVLRVLDDPDRVPVTELALHMDELKFRRIQERLCVEDALSAERIAEELWNADTQSNWSRLAARSLFRFGQRQSEDQTADELQRRQALEIVVKHGGRVLREFGSESTALDQPSVLAYHAAVADAAFDLWQQTGSAERGETALFLYEKLLDKRPQNAVFLRSTAVLAERLGSKEKALDCWRRLAAGTSQGTDAWFEAKFHLIQLLAALDVTRARQVMDQHKHLYPEYGPEPWGAKLRGLDEQIPAAPNAETPAGATEAPSS